MTNEELIEVIGKDKEANAVIKLIEICYSLVLTATSEGRDRNGKKMKGWMSGMSDDDKALWVTNQLRGCGYPTKPVGSSYGFLDLDEYKGGSYKSAYHFIRQAASNR